LNPLDALRPICPGGALDSLVTLESLGAVVARDSLNPLEASITRGALRPVVTGNALRPYRTIRPSRPLGADWPLSPTSQRTQIDTADTVTGWEIGQRKSRFLEEAYCIWLNASLVRESPSE